MLPTTARCLLLTVLLTTYQVAPATHTLSLTTDPHPSPLQVAPVTHAVTNTVKRVVIILASILVFKTSITPLGALGSAITISGALLYGLAKNKYK